jgi:hypothetical protein
MKNNAATIKNKKIKFSTENLFFLFLLFFFFLFNVDMHLKNRVKKG